MSNTKRRKEAPLNWAEVLDHKLHSSPRAEQDCGNSDRHYYNGVLLRTCLCGDSTCRLLVKRWIAINDDKRAGYHSLPVAPKKQETYRGQAILAYLNVIHRHIFGNGARVPNSQNSTRQYLALHHFHHALLHPNNGGPIAVVTNDLARQLGFTDSDRLPQDIVLETGYFAAPSYRLHSVETDLTAAEQIAAIAQNGPANNSPARKAPAVRELERLMRECTVNPRETATALLAALEKVQQQNDLIEKIETENKALELRNIALQSELDSMAEVFTNGGITRETLSSDSWHAANKNAANFLFGWKTWQTTKAWIEIFFDQMKQEVKSEGQLTDFESVLIVMMCCRVPMKQELAALIMGVNRSVISRKVEKWAPQLGRKGRPLSNLDLKSDFDFLSLQQCNQFGVAHYMTASEKDHFRSYIDAQMPTVFKKDNLDDVSLLVDGKDILTDSIRVNSGVNILMYSPKSKKSAGRILSWILAGGLNVYKTGLYLGRVSEERLVELHGEIDPKNIRLPPN